MGLFDWLWLKKNSPPVSICDLMAELGRDTMKAKLTWTDPTKRVDGSNIIPFDVMRVSLYDDGVLLGVVNGGVQTFLTEVLTPGTHNFEAQTTDRTGNLSAMSNKVMLQVPVSPPVAITDLAATLVP